MYRMLIQLSGRPGRYSAGLLRLLFGMPWGPARRIQSPRIETQGDEGQQFSMLTRLDRAPAGTRLWSTVAGTVYS